MDEVKKSMVKRPKPSPLLRQLAARAMAIIAMDKAPPAAELRGAGIAFTTPQGETLFLKRGAGSDHEGMWCLPGGGIEPGETPEQAAMRESREEIGALPYGERLRFAETHHEGVHFTTFHQPITHRFTPKLNHEHTEHQWAGTGQVPEPMHPGVRKALAQLTPQEESTQAPPAQDEAEEAKDCAEMAADEAMTFRNSRPDDRMAFDRGTVRRVDQDGRLHVEITNISKAAVNPYLGSEIPGWEELGLEPDQVYQLLRAPEELEAAAGTFNNLPVLSKHVPVSAQDHRPDLVVGSTGTDAVFEAPYLKNSMVVWEAKAIEGIERETAREISCAYRYVPVMEPCTYEGVRADGRMTQLVGNHLALVPTGRAGADVLVGDSALADQSTTDPKVGDFQLKEPEMKKPLSRQALLAKGALLGLAAPLLAADSKLDLNRMLAGVTAANWRDKKPMILATIKPLLASDADIGGLVQLLDAIDPGQGGEAEGDPSGAPGAPDAPKPSPKIGIDDDDADDALDADPAEEILAMLRGKLSDEDLAAVQAKLQAVMQPAAAPAADTTVPPGPDTDKDELSQVEGGKPVGGSSSGEKDKPFGGMDAAAVKKIVTEATEAVRKQAREAAEAREIVKPYVGTVSVALDSGEAVYKAALDLLKVKTENVHPSAYRAILESQPKPGTQLRSRVAMDASVSPTLATICPDLASIKQA